MIDIKYIKEKPDEVIARLAKKGKDAAADVAKIIELSDKRAALIGSLISEPELLLLDEVFSSLDYQTRLELCDRIHQKIRREKKTAILVTHDLAEAVSFSDRVLILSPRPATVTAEIPIIFPDTAQTPSTRRNTAAFTDHLTAIWEKF